ncbi:unnamed protein product [Gordionus sp. m RMFG-2023]|uniref:CD2 antigen cytoplasmic tail-binding protein 2-like n=1 Tax=Gordionus sp. m RMFG-2023 TaxID=3053472 RepID=UPI0030E04B67
MTKRRVTFKEDLEEIKRFRNDDENNIQINEVKNLNKIKRVSYSFKDKHSLDSDEEDIDKENNDENIKDLEINEIEECETINEYDGIKITPFNMKEEMEEGHFDNSGNFIFDKKTVEIRDNWIDNIDWVQIKKQENNSIIKDNSDSSDSEEEILPPTNFIEAYKNLIQFLEPGENILKALKRLGKCNKKNSVPGKYSASASERLKYKKELREIEKKNDDISLQTNEENDKTENEIKALLRLTELADEMLQNGVFDIYEYTHEKLSHLIKQNEESPNLTLNNSDNKILKDYSTNPVDENLDMFETID